MDKKVQIHTAKPVTPAKPSKDADKAVRSNADHSIADHGKAREVGGPSGPEPTRYGDWERGGRCVDF